MPKNNFPAVPSNATGPPGPDYNISGDKDNREPPGGYLGENKKKGGGKNKDCGGDNKYGYIHGGNQTGPDKDGWYGPPNSGNNNCGNNNNGGNENNINGNGWNNGNNDGGYGNGNGNGNRNNWNSNNRGNGNNGSGNNSNSNSGDNSGNCGGSNNNNSNSGNNSWNNNNGNGNNWNNNSNNSGQFEPDPTEPNYSEDVWDYIHYGASRANNNPSEMGQKIRSGNINARGTTTQYTPLHVAVKFDQVEAVKQLIAARARVDLQDILGQTALGLACCFDIGTDIPRRLLDAGSDIEHVDRYSWRPLFWAASKGYYDVVQLLVNRGANKYATDKRGQRPYAVASNQSIRALMN